MLGTEEEDMDLRRHKAKLATAGVLAAVAVGSGASIAAAGPDSTATPAADQQQADGEHADGPGSEEDAQDPAFTGTVPAPAETEQPDGQETPDGGGQEQAALQSLATVSQQQAEQAALAAVPGTVAETDLDAENGFVVYSVEINGPDGTVTEVVVDAGSGQVLAQQAQDAGDPADAADQPEQPGDPQD
jgi:uncharacterized membrane protein YkoI